MELSRPEFLTDLIALLVATGARKTTKFVSPTEVYKATRRTRKGAERSRIEVVLTLGRPNYSERVAIRKIRKSGLAFPVKGIFFLPPTVG